MRSPGTIAALALYTGLTPAASADYDAAVAAYCRGDYPSAFEQFLPLAEEGNAHAQDLIGRAYAAGKGVPEDDAEAVRWYRLAAEQALPAAQFNLGVMYMTGKGVSEDVIQAYAWFGLAAAQGYKPVQDAITPLFVSSDKVAEGETCVREFVADRLRRALGLPSQLPGRATRSDQSDQPAPVLRRVGPTSSCHQDTSSAQGSGVHESGGAPSGAGDVQRVRVPSG